MQDLQHLAIIWLGVFLASYLARRTQLTSVVYFLAFGCLMVNIGILPEETTPFIEGFAKIGIVLIMFALGFEENPGQFVQGIKRAWGIALFGAIAPFLTAYLLAIQFWGDAKLAMMCGLAMTATAVSLTMVSLRSEGLHRSDAARGIMTSAVLDDIAENDFIDEEHGREDLLDGVRLDVDDDVAHRAGLSPGLGRSVLLDGLLIGFDELVDIPIQIGPFNLGHGEDF